MGIQLKVESCSSYTIGHGQEECRRNDASFLKNNHDRNQILSKKKFYI